jgi:hypothetical protein
MGAFADLRADVADALAPIITATPEWSLHPLPVDAISPPAFLLVWADPWISRRLTACAYETQLAVRCVSARIDPDPGIETLELMVEQAIAALDVARIPVAQLGAPGPLDIGGLHYQAASLVVPRTLTIGE